MSIEAMKLALEALENGLFRGKLIAMREQAITVLRQAIEQDKHCKHCTDGCLACDARKLPEQAQKQEPDKYAMDIECTKCGAKQSGILTVNTTPPLRQPLTDRRARDLWHEAVFEAERQKRSTVIVYKEKLEAAHGIKGEA